MKIAHPTDRRLDNVRRRRYACWRWCFSARTCRSLRTYVSLTHISDPRMNRKKLNPIVDRISHRRMLGYEVRGSGSCDSPAGWVHVAVSCAQRTRNTNSVQLRYRDVTPLWCSPRRSGSVSIRTKFDPGELENALAAWRPCAGDVKLRTRLS